MPKRIGEIAPGLRNANQPLEGVATAGQPEEGHVGQRGEVRKRYQEGQENQLGALGLVVNAVALWNSFYPDQAVRQLREEGEEAREVDLARVSPLARSHINVLGRYHFTLAESVVGGGIRPLRDPAEMNEFEIFAGP